MKEPNEPLAALVSEAGFSWAGPARRVDALGTNEGLAPRYDYTAVNRWVERGERPRPPVPSPARDTGPCPRLRPSRRTCSGGRRTTTANTPLAQRYPIQALRPARASGSPAPGAHVLAGMSDQATPCWAIPGRR